MISNPEIIPIKRYIALDLHKHYVMVGDAPAPRQEHEEPKDITLQVAARPDEGFNYPYYLFVPGSIDRGRTVHILVQSNNTGIDSDDLAVHEQGARHLANRSDATRMARKLNVPLLVPVCPRYLQTSDSTKPSLKPVSSIELGSAGQKVSSDSKVDNSSLLISCVFVADMIAMTSTSSTTCSERDARGGARSSQV